MTSIYIHVYKDNETMFAFKIIQKKKYVEWTAIVSWSWLDWHLIVFNLNIEYRLEEEEEEEEKKRKAK